MAQNWNLLDGPRRGSPGSCPPRFSTYLDPELRRQLKIHAATVGRPVWEIVTEALTAYLDANK